MCLKLIIFCCSSYCQMNSPGGTWETAVDILQSAPIQAPGSVQFTLADRSWCPRLTSLSFDEVLNEEVELIKRDRVCSLAIPAPLSHRGPVLPVRCWTGLCSLSQFSNGINGFFISWVCFHGNSLLGACYPGWSGCYWQKRCMCIH